MDVFLSSQSVIQPRPACPARCEGPRRVLPLKAYPDSCWDSSSSQSWPSETAQGHGDPRQPSRAASKYTVSHTQVTPPATEMSHGLGVGLRDFCLFCPRVRAILRGKTRQEALERQLKASKGQDPSLL